MAKKDKSFSNNWSFCYDMSLDKTLNILTLFGYHSCIVQVDFNTPLIDMYRNYAWGDLWSEGLLMEVAQYVRGSKHLNLPAEWRAVLPEYVADEPIEFPL